MGALDRIRIIEFAGLGPAPFCAMMLADHGAAVTRIDRPGARFDPTDPLARGRRVVTLDTKTDAGRDAARALCRGADGVIEGFRPGVMERLGLGPDVLIGDNPNLIYGRMTGWGQSGPLAHAAGHDINYIALAGVLHGVGGPDGKPVPPLNYVGDFGGGAMMLAFGMVAGLLAVKNGAPGQVIDAAMTDGAALIGAMHRWMLGNGMAVDRAGANLLDGAAPFYDSYACADGGWVAVGAIEPAFYALLCRHAGVADDPAFAAQHDRAAWPALKQRLAAIFRTRTRADWCAAMEGSDACFAPILSMTEAPGHPHNAERGTFIAVGGQIQPAPAPRFSATPAGSPEPPELAS